MNEQWWNVPDRGKPKTTSGASAAFLAANPTWGSLGIELWPLWVEARDKTPEPWHGLSVCVL